MEISLTNSEMILLSKIEPNKGQIEGLPKNPRFIKTEKFNKLKKSLEDHPQMLALRELLVYPFGDKYIIIGGNMRYRAMKELKYKEAPCKVIPVDTSVEELKAYTIKDNSGFGEWDFDELANDWGAEDLEEWGLDLPAFELEETQEELNAEEDDFDETKDKVEPKCQFGEVWQLGEHRLMCGDSTDEECVKTLMGGELADMWLTDPPYNVAYEGKTKDKLTIQNDKMNSNTFQAFLTSAFIQSESVMKVGSPYYVWFASKEHINFETALNNVNLQVRQELIWVKNVMVLGRQDYQWRHEPCLYGWKEGASHTWYSDRKQTTILEFDKPVRNGEHPTMKPIPLFAYLIKNSSKEENIILDSFGGSGTTLIACEQLNRKCFMMEYDPHYCDVIIARWEKLTGKTAEKIKDSEGATL